LVTIIASLIIAIFTAIITVRLSLRRFRAERWWERKADTYSRIVEALHNALEYCEAKSDESLTHIEITPERKAQLNQDYAKATFELRKATGVGAYIISPAVSDALVRLFSQPSLDWEKTAIFEFYDHEREGYKTALNEIRELAKKDLEIMPHLHNKIAGWVRLGAMMSALWLAGCGTVVLFGVLSIPNTGWVSSQSDRVPMFFQIVKIPAVYASIGQLGIVSFPSTMDRHQMEDILRRGAAMRSVPTNSPIEWDVKPEKTSEFYRITFDTLKFLRIAIFPAIVLFIAVFGIGSGTRWVMRGFKP
jgi:hypothetical protein